MCVCRPGSSCHGAALLLVLTLLSGHGKGIVEAGGVSSELSSLTPSTVKFFL